MKERVYGEKVSIDTENTVSFYDQRAKTIKNRKQEYTTVLLGDQDPDFSVKWDAYEKQFILPKLKLNQDKVILDIGCGIGRWAEAVADQCKEYYGVDFSSEMIAVAKQNIKKENCHLSMQYPIRKSQIGNMTLCWMSAFPCISTKRNWWNVIRDLKNLRIGIPCSILKRVSEKRKELP